MKQTKGFLFALLPLLALSLAGCPLTQQTSTEKKSEDETTIKIERAAGVRFVFTPSAPIEKKEGEEDAYSCAANMELAAFDHHTGEFQSSSSVNVNESNVSPKDPNTYFFLKGAIEVPQDQEVSFDAERSSGTVSKNPLIAKTLRIAFYSEEGAFVYAPFQEASKCVYPEGDRLEQYGDDLLDKDSVGKAPLPNKSTTLVMWFDGNDENANDSAMGPFSFSLTLAFS